MRGILTAELHGTGLMELLSPTRSLVFEGPVKLRVEGTLRPEWRAKRDYKVECCLCRNEIALSTD